MGIPDRVRNWNFILYPESAPENWRDFIEETRIELVESPLHDKDINPTGEPKKPHHHITLLYPSVKTYDQVKELVVDQLKQPIPIKCQSVKGSIRYMVHKDNPEKHQYNWNEIVPHGGADLSALCSLTHTELLQIQDDIQMYIIENDIIEFEDIANYALLNNREWSDVLRNKSTIYFKSYLNSRRHRRA